MKKWYTVCGRKGEVYLITAKRLYERVIEDSKSDYNWIAHATELVDICDKKDFPKEYANEIKLAILNCFANLKLNKSYDTRYLLTDDAAVWYCYNSLIGTNEKIIESKRNYLTSVIKSIPLNHFRSSLHHGPIAKKMRNEWIKANLDKNIQKQKINFIILIKKLEKDFDDMIKKAEKESVFEEEDRQIDKERQEYLFKRVEDIIKRDKRD